MAHYCLANVLPPFKQEEILTEYQKSVDIYSNYFLSQFLLANALQREGRLSNAVVHYQKAAELDPENSWTYHGMAAALYRMGRKSDAIPVFLKAAEVDPQYAPYKDDLFRAIFFSGDIADTTSSFLAAVRSDPAGFSNLWENLQFDTNHVALINNLAWCFATNPDAKLRNGNCAVRLATRACEMTGFHLNKFVGTLAMADAEDARFDEAVSNAQLACSLTTAPAEAGLLKQYRALLQLFRAHKPFHVTAQ